MSSAATKKFLSGIKASKDVHGQFFLKPTSRNPSFIELDLLQNGKRIQAYRNPKCTKRDCMYSDIELANIFENDGRESQKYEYACRTCQTKIAMNAFVLDNVMQLAIEQASKMNSKSSMKILLLKDGSWKPHPDYSYNMIASIQPNAFYQNPLPDIQNFSLEDYKRLMQQYTNEWSSNNDFTDTAIDHLGIQIKFQDLYSIAFSSEITVDLMRFLLLFIESENQKSTSKWKIHYIGMNVSKFDDVSNECVFSYFDGFEQTLGFNDIGGKDIVVMVYLFEKMWTLVIYRVFEKQAIALNYFHLAQSQMLTKHLLATVLGLKSPTLKINPAFEIEKVQELPQSGNVTFFFLHDLILDKNFTRMNSASKEVVKMIRTQAEAVKWLTLKATENYIQPNMPSKRSIPRKPSSVRQTTQPARQPSLSVRQPSQNLTQSQGNTEPKPASYRQPSPRVMPYQSTTRSIPPPQSASSIRTAQVVQMEPKPVTPPPERPQYIPRESVTPLVTQKPSYRRSQQVKTPVVDENMVQLSKDELMELLEKVKQNVLYEVNNPKEDLAKKYVSQIDQFNVRTDKIDQQMPFSMQNQSILMSGADMYDILDKFKQDVRKEVAQDLKKGINYIDPILEKEEAEKNYQGFQQILWYYYQYQPEMYKQLIDEYNHRFHNQLLEKMGLKEMFSNKKTQPSLQPGDSQRRMPRDSQFNDLNSPKSMQRSNQRGSIVNNSNNNGYRNSIANNSTIDNTYRSSFFGSNDGSGGNRNSILNNSNNAPYNNNRQSMLGNSNQLNGSRFSGYNSNNISDSALRQRPDDQYRRYGGGGGGY